MTPFASVLASCTVMVYTLVLRLFAMAVVWLVGDQVKEKGPIPPIGLTVPKPKAEQVMEACVIARLGVGLIRIWVVPVSVQPVSVFVPVTLKVLGVLGETTIELDTVPPGNQV